jgi:hypothetical protein
MQAVPEQRRRRDPLIGGLVLVIIGALLLIGQFWPDIGRYTVLVIGLGILAVFALTRSYGALVGGSIVSGVGVGVTLGTLYTGEMTGSIVLMSLGGGFLFIGLASYVLNMPERHLWPLIPGTILVAIGAALAIGGRATELISYWPVILIVIGIIVMLAAYFRRVPAD